MAIDNPTSWIKDTIIVDIICFYLRQEYKVDKNATAKSRKHWKTVSQILQTQFQLQISPESLKRNKVCYSRSLFYVSFFPFILSSHTVICCLCMNTGRAVQTHDGESWSEPGYWQNSGASRLLLSRSRLTINFASRYHKHTKSKEKRR